MKNLIEDWTKDMNSQLTEKEVQIAINKWENYTIWLDDRETQTKPTARKESVSKGNGNFYKFQYHYWILWNYTVKTTIIIELI